MPRLAFCLLLLSFAAGAHAREIPLHGPNGNGGGACADDAGAPLAAEAPVAKSAPETSPRNKARAPTPLRGGSGGGGDDGLHAPRWHSFLPGMFR